MKENASCVALNDNENEKMLGPHALLCAHTLGDTSSSIYIIDAYATRQGNAHYVYHNTGSLFLTSVLHQQLPQNARPTRKRTRRCANRLVDPYSHV